MAGGTSDCFGRPCCFGHSEILHLIFKNENSSPGSEMQALVFFKIPLSCESYTNQSHLLLYI